MKNIIVIMSDQQRYDSLGCNGNPNNTTPFLDKIAEKGTLFTHAYTTNPLCGPARACLQTGLYPSQTGCFVNDIPLDEDIDTVAKRLSRIGYKSAYIGKWHLASSIGRDENFISNPIPKSRMGGYQKWIASDVLEFTSDGHHGYLFDENGEKRIFNKYRADAITDYALEILHTHNTTNPLFMFISYIEPHQQNNLRKVQGPEYSKEKFSDAQLPVDLMYFDGNANENYADYLGACHSIDNNVQRLFEVLKEKNILDDTVVIYTSDHGCHFMTRNKDYKRTCHDSSTRVPLIIHGGEFSTGSKIQGIVSLLDLPKTIIQIAGGDTKDMMGYDLVDIKNKTTKREFAYIQISEATHSRCVVTEKFKYCVRDFALSGFECAIGESYEDEYLYDLNQDEFELNNLIEEPSYDIYKEKLRELLKLEGSKIGDPINFKKGN